MTNQNKTMSDTNKMTTHNTSDSKRALLSAGALAITASLWSKPVINSVILPAHAQTSMCVTDMTVGGPLAGNASGAMSCLAACEVEATNLNAQLCEVRETTTASGTDCACDIDTT